MSSKQLSTYLNNHLAASVAVLDLLSHLETAYADTEVADFLTALRADIHADRTQLEAAMAQLEISQNSIRQTVAWFVEKINQLQLKWDDGDGALHLLEALEIVASGIAGKRALGHSLVVVAQQTPHLQPMDFERLVQRSEEQLQRLEPVRLRVAKDALTTKDEVKSI